MVGRVESVVPSQNYGIITDEHRQRFVFLRSGVADGQFDCLAAHEAVIFEPRGTASGGWRLRFDRPVAVRAWNRLARDLHWPSVCLNRAGLVLEGTRL